MLFYHSVLFLSSLFSYFFCIFFNQFSRHHNLMPAAFTFQTKIRSHTKNLPFMTSAWVWLLIRIMSPTAKRSSMPLLLFFRYQPQPAVTCNYFSSTNTPCNKNLSSSFTFVHVDKLTILDCAFTSTSTA